MSSPLKNIYEEARGTSAQRHDVYSGKYYENFIAEYNLLNLTEADFKSATAETHKEYFGM